MGHKAGELQTASLIADMAWSCLDAQMNSISFRSRLLSGCESSKYCGIHKFIIPQVPRKALTSIMFLHMAQSWILAIFESLGSHPWYMHFCPRMTPSGTQMNSLAAEIVAP